MQSKQQDIPHSSQGAFLAPGPAIAARSGPWVRSAEGSTLCNNVQKAVYEPRRLLGHVPTRLHCERPKPEFIMDRRRSEHHRRNRAPIQAQPQQRERQNLPGDAVSACGSVSRPLLDAAPVEGA